MGKHVLEMVGMSKVVIEDGKITDVSEPSVRYCPLFKKYRDMKVLDCDSVRRNAEFRMNDFGMCDEHRKVRMEYFTSFGVTELMASAMKAKMIDTAVIVGDGCGTVVLNDPEVVQGVGGRMSGISETSPIKEIIEAVGTERVLDPETATIDQFAGVHKAFAMHASRVGVTVTNAGEAAAIRDCFGWSVRIFAVHTTGTSAIDAERMFDFCDIITACASKTLRETAKKRSLMQVGTMIPLYAATEEGVELLKMRLDELGKRPDTSDSDIPSPLI